VTDRRMERICLSTLKQLDTALETEAFMEASELRYMPRSRTNLADCTKSVPTRVGFRGISYRRRLVAHHSASVFTVFSCRQLLLIHDETSSTQLHSFSLRLFVADGSHEP